MMPSQGLPALVSSANSVSWSVKEARLPLWKVARFALPHLESEEWVRLRSGLKR